MVDATSRRVLIVDDEALILEVLSEHFKTDFEVETAANGADALGAILRQRPDVVLLDINMPRMNGYEVLRHVRADPRRVAMPVLMVSGLDEISHTIRSSVGSSSTLRNIKIG